MGKIYQFTRIASRALGDIQFPYIKGNLTIPDTVTELGAGAFYMAGTGVNIGERLGRITIGHGVKTIGTRCFQNAQLSQKGVHPYSGSTPPTDASNYRPPSRGTFYFSNDDEISFGKYALDVTVEGTYFRQP
jgi:hypothetical protein